MEMESLTYLTMQCWERIGKIVLPLCPWSIFGGEKKKIITYPPMDNIDILFLSHINAIFGGFALLSKSRFIFSDTSDFLESSIGKSLN